MARRWRVHHPGFEPAEGVELQLSDDESHHVRRVLRLAVGDPLGVFDGSGEEWAAVLEDLSGRATVRLQRRLDDEVEPPIDLVLYQGLCRQDKMDWVVQKLTEVGASAIHPLGCRNAERFPPDGKRLERWRRIVVEACKQSGRRRVPAIEATEALPAPAQDVLPLLLDSTGEAEPLAASLERSAAETVWIAAGPESGFSVGEVERAAAAGWRRVSLGPRILRTESVGLAAASIVLHALGDLGR